MRKFFISFALLFLFLSLISNCDNQIIDTTATLLPAEPIQLTFDEHGKFQPAWSHDGSRIAFVAEEPLTRVVLQSLNNDERRVLGYFVGRADDYRDYAPAPQKAILAAVDHRHRALKLINLITGEIETVTDGDGLASPVWSPRGDRLAFIQQIAGKSILNIHDAASGEIRQILSQPQHFRRLAWSADEQKFVIESGLDSTRLLQFRVTSGQLEEIVHPAQRPLFPAFSKDGRFLAFITQSKNGMGLSIYDESLKAIRKISRDYFIAATPHWSAEDRMINFSEEYFIATIAVDGSDYRRSAIRNSLPVWTKPGDAFLRFEKTGRAIIRIVDIATLQVEDATAVEQPQIGSNWNIRDLQPSWSADDSRITFTRFDSIGELTRFFDLDLLSGKIKPSAFDSSSSANQIKFDEFNAELSPDGQQFVHNRNGDIIITDLRSQKRINLSRKSGEPFIEPTWFSDGHNLAAINPLENRIKLLELRSDPDSLIITPIEVPGFSGTINGEITNIVFSGDHKVLGPRFAFGYEGAIYMFYFKGFKIEQIIAHGSYPAFSPDGELLAYVHENQVKIIRLFHEFQ